MGLVYRLEDYAAYRDRVGMATYIDVSRRTDPARVSVVWDRLADVIETYGAPWVTQLWTKDPAGALTLGRRVLETLLGSGTTVTAQITVTGLAGTVWEPRVPQDVSAGLDDLAELLGGYDHICWRYDPIVPAVHSMRIFCALATKMAGLGITRGTLNFLAPVGRYKRVDRRIARALPDWKPDLAGARVDLDQTASDIVSFAAELGIEIGCCAESSELVGKVPGLRPAACGDYEWFSHLSRFYPPRTGYRGSRSGCGCLRYFDVGSYGMRRRCFGCLYCYAG